MTKKEFIQRVMARTVPPLEKVADGIRYAEQLWQRLTEHGYGAATPTGPRENKDWYSLLQGESKRRFDAFWRAFAHKKGRNRAAMRWYQMGDMPASLADTIIRAAAAEAARPLAPGEVRKMAEGWLAEKRWIDHEAPSQSPEEHCRIRRRDLQSKLAAYERLNRDGQLDDQIADLKRQLAEMAHG